MYIKSVNGVEIFKNEYQIHDSINGIPTIELDYTQLEQTHTEPIYFLSKAWNDRFSMIIKEEEAIADSKRVKFTGVHSFVYDFIASRIYEKYTQYFALETVLDLIFEDTGYDFEVAGGTQYYSEHFQNFGDKDKMALFNQVLDRWNLEFHVRGTTVYLSDARGNETTRQFRYKMNITSSKVNLDVSNGATYIRGFFGRKPEEHDEDQTDTSFEREMTHELADTYGIRHAPPYSNQNITTVDTADEYLKQRLEDTWKLTIEIDVIDLEGDDIPEVGDTVWAIDERLDLKFKTRIVELITHYDIEDNPYKATAVLGNETMISDMQRNEVTAQDLIEEVEGKVNQSIEDSRAEFDNNFNQMRDEIRDTGNAVLQEALDNIEAKEEAMRDDFAVWADDLVDLREDYLESIGYINTDISDIQDFIGDTSENLRTILDGIEYDDTGIRADLDEVEGTLAIQATTLEDIDGVLTGHSASIDANAQAITQTLTRTEFNNFNDTYTDTINSITNTADSHTQAIAEFEGHDLPGRITIAEQTLDGFENTVADLSDSLNASIDLIPKNRESWERGWINVDGIPSPSNRYLRVKSFIPIENVGSLYYWSTVNLYRLHIRFYDEDLEFISGLPVTFRGTSEATPSNAKYVKILLQDSSTTSIEFGDWINGVSLFEGNSMQSPPRAYSQLAQRVDAIQLVVSDFTDGVLRQSDIEVTPEHVQIGSAILGDDEFASIFRVSPNSIEAIAESIDFRGNLNVFGKIAGISVEAVTSSFGEVYADYIEGGYSKVEYLEAFDAEVKRAFIKEATIEELFAHSATIRELEAVDLTANQIRIAFNDISPNVQIDNQSMEFYDGANRVARMDRFGSRFYHTGREVGQIGPSRIVNSNHRGLRFFLGQDAEYMAWTTSTGEGLSDVKLMWAKGDSDYKEGFTFYDRVRLRELIPLNSTHDAESLNLLSTNAFSPGRSTILGIDNVDADSIPTGNIRGGSQVIFKPGTTHVRATAYSRVAFLEIISNSTRNVLTSNAPYEFTTTSASNYLTIDDQWQFRRLTSSKKYKYHNKFIDAVTASKLLEINPATWFDKTAVDDYTSELNDNYDGLDKDEIEQKKYVKEKIKPIPGLYAEDVKDAGLEDFVTYNEDGEVDGINQNLWVLLIPIVKELRQKISDLEERISNE